MSDAFIVHQSAFGSILSNYVILSAHVLGYATAKNFEPIKPDRHVSVHTRERFNCSDSTDHSFIAGHRFDLLDAVDIQAVMCATRFPNICLSRKPSDGSHMLVPTDLTNIAKQSRQCYKHSRALPKLLSGDFHTI
jgi:hypothetical protein